jgi:hypothetical protein
MTDTTATTPAKKAAPKGIHLVVANGVVYPETSEIKALRRAMAENGTTTFVEFGKGLVVKAAPAPNQAATPDKF